MTEPIRTMTRRDAMVAALAVAAWPRSSAAAPDALPAPLKWPTIALIDGGVLQPSDWIDRAAVVVFWSTTCPFCRRHNEHVAKLHAASAGQRLRVLGVAIDRDVAAVRRYMAEHGHAFAVTLDAARLRPMFTTRTVIPMTCPVDRSGRLLQAIPGEMFEEDVLELGRLAAPRRGA